MVVDGIGVEIIFASVAGVRLSNAFQCFANVAELSPASVAVSFLVVYLGAGVGIGKWCAPALVGLQNVWIMVLPRMVQLLPHPNLVRRIMTAR